MTIELLNNAANFLDMARFSAPASLCSFPSPISNTNVAKII